MDNQTPPPVTSAPLPPVNSPAAPSPITPSGPQSPKKRLPWPLVVIAILVVAILAGTGYYIVNHKATPAAPPQPAKTAVTTAPSTKDGDWTIAAKPQLFLTKMGLSITLPAALTTKALYKYDSANLVYDFSLRSIVDNTKCSTYFTDDLQQLVAGLQLWQYPGTTSASGQVGSSATAAETLADYYTANKSSAGNYFTDSATGRNYYKIGTNFYVLFSDPPAFHQQHLAGFTAACPTVDPNWQQNFVDAMATLAIST